MPLETVRVFAKPVADKTFFRLEFWVVRPCQQLERANLRGDLSAGLSLR